jgi:dipeptidyl aminopeptidase/acylaminoacyl peptidase
MHTLRASVVLRPMVGLASCFVGSVGFAGFVAGRAATAELSSLEPTSHPVPRAPGDDWLARATDVTLKTPKGVALRGWQFTSTNGAAVVLVHGSGADRTQLLPEARILTSAGYGVLVFDQPGNGESGGRKRRGDEQDFLRAAVDALAASPDVRKEQIGAYGFSTGAAVLAGVAATDTRLRGIVLAGCYTDTDEHVRHDYRRWGPLSGEPALWVARLAGMVPLHPLQSVSSIAPRALLLIAGDADPVVPWDSSKRLYAAASQPKDLWILHGAGHGRYIEIGGEEYARRLVAFFEGALRRPVSQAATPADR